MAALGVPTTRVLSIVHTPKRMVQRETIETGSIVCRLSPSWIRFGSFEIFFYRMERKQLRSLADFVVEEVYGLKIRIMKNMEIVMVDYLMKFQDKQQRWLLIGRQLDFVTVLLIQIICRFCVNYFLFFYFIFLF